MSVIEKPMKVDAILCLLCKDVVWSRSRHDFRHCSCQACFIDGGRDYTRVGYSKADDITFGRLDVESGEFTPQD